MSEAKATLRCFKKRLWLRRYQGSARPGSDGVAVVLCCQVQHQAVALWDSAKALVGYDSLFCQLLAADIVGNGAGTAMKGDSAGVVSAQSVGDRGNDFVGSIRGSGKNVLGHGTFTPVGELVLADSHRFRLVGVLIAGVGPLAF
ncbi:hypothetical protein BHR41_02455 [Aeromonas salmonicida subsp. salmonicida]|nr:hypothetical protein AXW79_01410 [Aeromonas salmonicida subsp. salmonicida]OKA78051.1 hypothetical protein BHR41_02455 [Aeromonas salmonicida subsp. salmonicida]